MSPESFAYWLQGYVEINGSRPSDQQWQVIKDHLTTVFSKVTPPRRLDDFPNFIQPRDRFEFPPAVVIC